MLERRYKNDSCICILANTYGIAYTYLVIQYFLKTVVQCTLQKISLISKADEFSNTRCPISWWTCIMLDALENKVWRMIRVCRIIEKAV
jgi:hypothetical protein